MAMGLSPKGADQSAATAAGSMMNAFGMLPPGCRRDPRRISGRHSSRSGQTGHEDDDLGSALRFRGRPSIALAGCGYQWGGVSRSNGWHEV